MKKVKMSKNIKKNHQKTLSSHDKKMDKSIQIFGVGIVGTQKREVLKKIWLQRREMLHVATVNPEYIMEARHNDLFKNVLSKCLTVADGWGVVWANKIIQSQMTNSLPAQAGQILKWEIGLVVGKLA